MHSIYYFKFWIPCSFTSFADSSYDISSFYKYNSYTCL